MQTRIERVFDPNVVRRLKADVRHDITVDGPELAARVTGWSCRRASNDRLPVGRRRHKTVLPGSCAAEAGVGRRVPVPPRRGRSAVRRPRLIDRKRVDPQSFGFVSRAGVKGRA